MEPKVIPMKMEDNVTVETITADVAREYLDKNNKNRPVKAEVVKRYVAAILSNNWELNGETIKFSISGRLLDGQHRLMAVLESGSSIMTYVVRGLPEEVFDTIDCGVTRTVGDVLALEGAVNSNTLGVALRLLYVHEQLGSIKEMGTKFSKLITTRDLIETYERHPGLEKSVTYLINLRGLAQRMSIAVAAFCHYLFAQKHAGLAESFFIRLQKGTDTTKGHPLHELRIRLDNIQRHTHAGRIEVIALTIQAWNAFKKSESLKSLSYDKGADFPEVE